MTPSPTTAQDTVTQSDVAPRGPRLPLRIPSPLPHTADVSSGVAPGPEVAAVQPDSATESAIAEVPPPGDTSVTRGGEARPLAVRSAATVLPGPVDGIVGAVVEPLITPNAPAAQAAQTTAEWGLMAWVQRTFFNQTPTLAYDPTQTTQVGDVLTGTLNPVDPDGDTLTFRATAPVNGGEVTIASDGTFAYRPTDALAAAGGTDTFQVTVSDEGSGFHVHGLSGLANLLTLGLIGDGGHATSTTVTVDVNAAPLPATPAYTLGAAERTTGTLVGELHVTDADSDPLSYNVTGGPAAGSVTLAADGTFTYTPTATARHDAAADDAGPAELADSFTVTVDDNHGRAVDILVTVTVDPTNNPPTITGLTISDPDTDGTVNVSITVADPDGDPVTYLVVHDPAYGTVAPSLSGFTYKPTDEARQNAAADADAEQLDSFTISVDDAHGGVVGVPVAVKILGSYADPITSTTTVEAEDMTISGAGRAVVDSNASAGYALALSGPATASTTLTLPESSVLTIRVMSGAGAPDMTVAIDGVPITTVLVESASYSDFKFAGAITAGSHVISISSSTATSRNTLYLDKVVTTTGPIVDEFMGESGSAPSSGIWTVRSGTGFDAGIQTYEAGNVFLDGQGHLVIQATRGETGGYASGWVWSKNNVSFGYGTISARIKMPEGQGLWPAFWLMGADSDTVGWPQSGEIDVVEMPSTTTTVYSTLHGPIADSTATQQAQIISNLPDLSTDYHDYWVRHLENEVTFGVDNQTLGTLTPESLGPGETWVYNRPMYAILNLGVGGPWAGAPNDSTRFPATMIVDRVRWDPAT
jgi:VCBS repeat-containing protein